MSQMGSLATASLLGAVDSITGNSGGVVAPDAGGNINVVGGNNITTVGNGSPNTLTVNVSGTTNHAVQIGNASGSLTSIPVGTNGQVLLGATTADPAFATLTSTGGTITFTPGANTLNLEASISGLEAITYEARASSGSIAKGQLVFIDGYNGGLSLPLVTLADSNTSNVPTHGMALTAFDTVTTGTVQICGLITGVNTSTFTTGDVLFLSSTAGAFDANQPDGESNSLNPIGSVVQSAVSGSILLNIPSNVVQAPNLDDHNVFIGITGGTTDTATLSNGIQTYNTASHTFTASTVTQNGALYGGASNTISSTSVGSNGQVLLGATAAAPAFATLTSTGGTITFTPGANTLNLESTSVPMSWTQVTGTSASMAINNGYIANNVALVTLTLPAVAALGSIIRVTGKGAGGWRIAQNAGQTIYFGTSTSTTGATGHIDSTQTRDTVELVCVTANNDWNVISSVGNISLT